MTTADGGPDQADLEAAPAWSGTARVVRGDAVLEERSAGRRAGPGSPSCDARTRFQAGSISKLVLSVVALALVEQGRLHLHEPVIAVLDQAPPEWSTITLHQLLSHTAGLGHWGDVPGLPAVLAAPPPRDELVALVADAPLVHPPGSGWRYSGPGFVVAGLVLEAVSGRPYGDLAAELVIGPAGLRATTSGEFAVGRPEVALGHRHGRPVEVHPGFADLPGTGDLWTTTEDLVALAQALRAGRLLRPETAALLWTEHARVGGPADGEARVRVVGYGYGTFLGSVEGQPARINPGDNPGYQSLLAHLPDRDLDLAVLCNEDAPSVDAALADLASVTRPAGSPPPVQGHSRGQWPA